MAVTMRAVRVERVGPPAIALSVADVPWPEQVPGQVLVRVAAAGVNPSDVENVAGAVSHPGLPRTPGRDFAGTVVYGPGELMDAEVFGTGGDLGFARDGTHAEFVAVPVAAVVPKPGGWSMAQAAAAGVPFVTAAAALTAATFAAADLVLVTGATGSVGSATVQVARWCGARVVAVVRRADQADRVRALGASDVIVTGGRPLADAVRAATGGAGVSLAVDTVGEALFEQVVPAMADRGRTVVMTASGPAARAGIDLQPFCRKQLRLIGVNTLALDAVASAGALRTLSAGFASGALLPPAGVRGVPLGDAVAAYEAVGRGGGGKVVLITA